MLVNECRLAPFQCRASGKTKDKHGFIDTGVDLEAIDPVRGERLYVSVSWITDMAREHGDMVSRHVLEQTRNKVAELQERLARLEALDEAIGPVINALAEQRAEELALELATEEVAA